MDTSTTSSDNPDPSGKPKDLTQTAVLKQMRERIFARRPILGEIMRKHGGKTLYQYSQEFLDVNMHPKLADRKNEMIKIVKSYVKDYFGSQVSREVARQLEHCYMVSTCDHHAPITHPFFVNSNIVSGLSYRDCDHDYMKYMVVFSYGTVSLNNNSSYSRGILFNAGIEGKMDYFKLPFFPDSEKTATVYGLRPYTERDLNRAKGVLKRKMHTKEISSQVEEKIIQLISEIFGDEDVLEQKYFSDQITLANYKLWQKFFHSGPHKIPDLLYLEVETLINVILLRTHFNNPESTLYKFIFDPQYLDLVEKFFSGIEGAFDISRKYGTFLFWGMDHKNRRIRLFRDGMRLKSEDGSFDFELTPNSVATLLEQKKIMPSMLITYVVASLYYGLKCLGGFSQVNYLTEMKEAWVKMMAELGNYKEVELCARVQTKELCEGLTIAYLENSEKKMIPATGIDLILYGNEKLWDRFIRVSKHLTLEDLIEPMLPEIYRVVYSSQDREEHLMHLTPEEIFEMQKMGKKFTKSKVTEK